MNTSILKKPLAAIVALVAAHGVSAYAEVVLEEVIVTARKQAENLQQVPVAVTAFSADQIDKLGVSKMDQLARQVPNVTLESSRATNSTLTAYIRGIGQQDPLWGFEPGVGVYIDDVYYARPQGAMLDIYDVERIEVLRGPQGSLYGKNTIGGAIKYVTRSVKGDTDVVIEGTVGTHNQQDLKIAAKAPIIEDTLWAGIALASLNRDGFGEYIGPQQKGEENYNKDVQAGRISLEWQASDAVNVRFDADRIKDTSNNRGGHRLTTGTLGEPVLNDVFDTRSGIDPDQEVTNDGQALTISWDINDNLTFKSVSSHREGDTETSIDFDNEQAVNVEAPGTVYSDEQTSQEFQLSYQSEQFKGVAGLYWFDGEATGAFDLHLFDNAVGTRTRGSVDTKSQALYAQGTYYFDEQWSLTLGGRYTKDEKDTVSFFSSFNTFAGIGTFDNQFVASDFTRSEEWSEFSPRIGTEFRINDDVMLFASFASGFKSGGVDPRANLLGNPSSGDPFDPEIVDTIELGVKSELLDGRVRLNVTLFQNDYTDQQVATSILIDADNDGSAESFAGQVVNAGEASAQGLEIESLIAISESLTMNLTIGYIDAEIDEFITVVVNPATGLPEPVNVADQRVVSNTPELTTNLGFSYTTPVAGGDLSLNGNWSYRDEISIFEIPSPIDQDSYTVFNASAVWSSNDQHWRVGLHGTNLTDKEYRTGGYNFPTLSNSIIGYYGDPRQVSLKVGYRF